MSKKQLIYVPLRVKTEARVRVIGNPVAVMMPPGILGILWAYVDKDLCAAENPDAEILVFEMEKRD